MDHAPPQKPAPAPPPSAAMLAEARTWWALTSRDAAVAENLAAFAAWLDADESHPAAFEKICLEQAKAPRGHAAPASGRLRRWAWGAVTAVALVTAGVTLVPGADSRPDAKSWRQVSAADGSMVEFGPGSRAWLDYDSHHRTIRLDHGAIIVDAAKDAGRPLLVKTPHGTVRVVGTRFTVIADDGATEVMVSRGRVEVSDGTPPRVVALTPNQGAHVDDSGISRLETTEPEAIRAGWRSLNAAPLRTLTDALADQSGRTIIIMPSAAARGGTVSGRFHVADAEATLALAVRAYGLRRADGPLGLVVLY